MDNKKHTKKRIISFIACILAVVMVSVVILPVSEVTATKNYQIEGLVIWGTSNVARIYNDLGDEVYARGSGREGSDEQPEHIWTSPLGNGGYLNYGKFRNYSVADAPGYAALYDYGGGVTQDTTHQSNAGPQVYFGLLQARDRGWFTDKDGNPKCQCAVVLYTGEDWIVRNADSSDKGLRGDEAPTIMRADWMGLDVEDDNGEIGEPATTFFAHYFDPAPGANGQDPLGDVLHQHISSGNEHHATGDLTPTNGSHIGREENVVAVDIDDEDCLFDDYAGAPSDRIGEATSGSDWHHSEVWNNSYMISDEHLTSWEDNGDGHMNLGSGFSYDEEHDSISVELEHEMNQLSDPWKEDETLPLQAGTTYARILGGYNYEVEFLIQDIEKTPEGHLNEKKKIRYYTPTLHTSYPRVLDDGAQTTFTTTTIGSSDSSDAQSWTYNPSGTTTYNGEDWDHSGLNADNWDADPEYQIVYDGSTATWIPNWVDEGEYVTTTDTDTDPVTGATTTTTTTEWVSNWVDRGWYEYTNSYHYEYRTTVNRPAWYDWQEVEVEVDTRCDEDKAPNAGYADSMHYHLIGGNHKDTRSEEVDKDGNHLTDLYAGSGWGQNPDLDAENYQTPIGGSTTYQGVGEDTVDSTKLEMWYTNPEKPIMKPDTDSRHVKGYIEFWKSELGSDLKVYQFSMGPYNKAIYDDQMDEYWTDGGGLTDTGRGTNIPTDTNNDGKVDLKDRVNTNNANTMSVAELGGISDSKWVVGGTTDNTWDFRAGGAGYRIDEITRTKRIDSARKQFNNAAKPAGAKFIETWDITLDHTPYYRFHAVVSAGATLSSNDDAQHGKWYDRNVDQWIFHMLYSTVLQDNPNPDQDEPIDISLYGASCALTAYANEALGPSGREGGSGTVHQLTEVLAGGPGGAGAIVGYGDKEYGDEERGFLSNYVVYDTETNSVSSYAALMGLEDGAASSATYEYARYGHLLQDLGIDEVGQESSVSPRTVSGLFIMGGYAINAGVTCVWDFALDLLKGLNPFQIFHNASEIAAAAKSGMYNSSDSYLVKLAVDHPPVQKMLTSLGKLYDTLAGGWWSSNVTLTDAFEPSQTTVHRYHFSFTTLYLLLFIAWFLLAYNMLQRTGRWGQEVRSKTKALLIRIVFFAVGIPLLGMCYTQVLNGVDEVASVAASPSAQMVASTFVDFSRWVEHSRLDPPADATLVSSSGNASGAGKASGDSILNLRKTAWAINSDTELFPNLDSSSWAGKLGDARAWDATMIQEYTAAKSEDFFGSVRGVQQVFKVLREYMGGDMYYSSDFNSATMTAFAASNAASVGNHIGIDLETGKHTDVPDDFNDNSLYQMFEQTVDKQEWMDRSVDENTQIFAGNGKFGSGSSDGTDWSLFNIYANGALTASATPGYSSVASGNRDSFTNATITYGSSRTGAIGHNGGLSMSTKTGLSTLAMYNYLCTDFQNSRLLIFSVANAPNGHTASAHYKVNMIGSGAIGGLFFFNCLAFLFACAIVGFVYALGMAFAVIKRGFKMIMSIPVALVGVLPAIIRVVVYVISMILEIIVSILAYQVIAEFLFAFVTFVEGPIYSMLQNTTTTGLVGGIVNWIGPANVSVAGSLTVYLVSLVVSGGLLFAGSGLLIKVYPTFMRVFCKAVDVFYLKSCVNAEQAEAYLKTWEIPVPELPIPEQRPVSVYTAFMQVLYGPSYASC